MLKKGIALFMAMALCVGLSIPATAASQADYACQAIALYEEFVKSPPPSPEDYIPQYAGHFYLDFNQDGIPELVLLYRSPVEDMCAVVYFCDGPAQGEEGALVSFHPEKVARVGNSYPSSYDKGLVGDSLYTSYGGSGGMSAAIVRFADGTYGLHSWDSFGGDCTARYAGFGADFFEATSQSGTEVYLLHPSSAIPSPYQYFQMPAAGANTAHATAYSILVDGKPVEFDAYALRDAAGNETNYLKLRDVAHVLNGTAAQFDVGWNQATGTISIATGTPYASPNGSEMSSPFSGDQVYTENQAAVLVDGAKSGLAAITITDASGKAYTYFKLRDLGQALGFDVRWDAQARAIIIDTTAPYQG